MNKWLLAALCGTGAAIAVVLRSDDELPTRALTGALAFVLTSALAFGILTLLRRRG